MTDLRLLGKKERTLLSSIANMQEFIHKYKADTDYTTLDLRMNKLDEIFNNYVEVRMQIEVITDETDDEEGDDDEADEDSKKAVDAVRRKKAAERKQREEENIKKIADFEKLYYEIKGQLIDLIQAAQMTLPASAGTQTVQPAPGPGHLRVKLPELKLPRFDGNLREWTTFRDSFISMIHDNVNLSDMDKFTYLRSSLDGDALSEISTIEVKAVHYSLAWSTLNERFENKKLLVKAFFDAIFAIKPMEKESFSQLNRVVNEFETNLMMLKKIGVETDGLSAILQHMVCQRLESSTLRNWENHHQSKEVPKYSDLIKFLKGQCMVLQNIPSVEERQGESKRTFRPALSSYPGVQSDSVCPFCKEPVHSPFKCIKFTSLKTGDRVEEVMRHSLCLNCLHPGHIARNCSRGSCHTCGRNHHTLLHAGTPGPSQFNTRPYSYDSQQANLRSLSPNSLAMQNRPDLHPTAHPEGTGSRCLEIDNQNQQSTTISQPNATESTSTSHNNSDSLISRTI